MMWLLRRNGRRPRFFITIRRVLFLAVAVGGWLPAHSQDSLVKTVVRSDPAAAPQQNLLAETYRKKVASGEYEVIEEGREGAVGPFGEEVYDFHESWTLWQDGRREYQVEGDRRFRTRKDPVVSHMFRVNLTRDLTVAKVTEFAALKWVPDSGPLMCEFLAREMHCSTGGAKPDPKNDWHIAVQQPYGLLWPISPFSLGGVARESERELSKPTRVSLLTIEQPSVDDPVRPTVLGGELHYLGVEDFSTAGRNWHAYKFSIKVPLHPRFLLWTSPKGLLLGLTVEHTHPDWPKEGVRLVRYAGPDDF